MPLRSSHARRALRRRGSTATLVALSVCLWSPVAAQAAHTASRAQADAPAFDGPEQPGSLELDGPAPGNAPRTGNRDTARLEVAIDYETGSFSQCTTMYAPSSEKPSVVTRTHEGTAPRAGRFMGKFPAADGGEERTQCNGPAIHRQGEYDYIGGSTLVERSQFACPGPWRHSIFFEPHHEGSGPPAWTMEHRNCQYTFRSETTGDQDGLAPLERGRWNDFVIYVKWSNRSDGRVIIWHKLAGEAGYRQVSDRRLQTITSGRDRMYWVNGYYRNSDVDGYGVVYNDEVRIGKTFDAVDPDPRILGLRG